MPQVSAQETVAEWTFNYDYDIVDGVGTPNTTEIKANASVNLESVKLKPNSQAIESAEFYVTTIRHSNTGENPMQSSNGAYLEYASISADGAALHMTSPLPNPETDATSFTWNGTPYDYSPAGTYSYSNPYNYFEFELNTADYSSLTLTVKAAGHNCPTDGQKVVAMASVDKSSWTQLPEVANLKSGYKTWTTTTFTLPATLNRQAKCYVRLMPASTWQANNERNKDNQLNLDNVKLEGTFSTVRASVESLTISGAEVTTGTTTDWFCNLSKSYTSGTLTFNVASSNAVLTVTAADEETGSAVTVTDNGSGSYTMPTPAGNKATIVTINVAGVGDAVVTKNQYTLRIFHLQDIIITQLVIDGKTVDLLSDLNGASAAATLSGNIYTAVPPMSATFIDGGSESAVGVLSGNKATYTFSHTMEGDTRNYTLTVEGIHIYNATESDNVVTFKYDSNLKAEDSNSWTKDGYTLYYNSIDGWGGSQFKINSSTLTWKIPANVKVKQMTMKSFFSNYDASSADPRVVSVESDRATVYLPTNSNYQQGDENAYDLIVNFENHVAGKPITITLQGGGQPVAWFEFVYEEVPTEVTTTTVGWASACLAYDAKVPADTKAYYVSSISGSNLVLTPIEIIPAGEGFIYNAPAGSHTFAASETTPDPIDNKLVGTLSQINVTANSIYVLGKRSDDNVGFLLYTGTTLAAGKAYLPAPGDGAKGSYSFVFNDATGIEAVKTATITDAPLYNLNGQRVEKPAKGLYIQNGRKVIIK